MGINALDIAISGLRVAQSGLNVTANNVANASTEGYTRKIAPQEGLSANGQLLGVKSSTVIRSVNTILQQQINNQQSVVGSLSVQEQFLQRIQSFHGSSDAEISIPAGITDLSNSFSSLSTSPDDISLLASTVSQAEEVADKINSFSDLLVSMRNETQDAISLAVYEINDALQNIQRLNVDITSLFGTNVSTADLEDQRDLALQTVSKYLEVSTFKNESNSLSVLTETGQSLVDSVAREISFNPNRLLATSYYPGGGTSGLFIGNSTDGVDITNVRGGEVGALLELRDETLPEYHASLDELAQKLTSRISSQGLDLFTDNNGLVPENIDPPNQVDYAGYASNIQVNQNILDDHTLLRSGTNGNTVLAGSSDIIRKVLDFAFGEFEYMQSTGDLDISAGTIFANAGLSQSNTLIGDTNISSLTSLDSDPDIAAGAVFNIQIGAAAPQAITINASDTATDLVNSINAALGAGTARINGLGGLVFEANADITISDTTLGAAGVEALGLAFGTTTAIDPSFQIQLAEGTPLNISISSTDTATDLLNNINALSGITASLDANGFLNIIPDEGGSISLNDGAGSPLEQLGVTTAGVRHDAFRQSNLGADGTLSTSILSTLQLEDYARNIISTQSQDYNSVEIRLNSEVIFYENLETRFQGESGVDIDKEMTELIRLQTAYTAAARMITSSEELFDALIRSF